MISFQSDYSSFLIKNEKQIINWITTVINKEGKELGEIAYKFTDDKSILEINKRYLNHNYYTDIITFDYCENDIISSDIVISIDTVKANAKFYNVHFYNELLRVIIHGILHLLNYDDKTNEDQKRMTDKEDECLRLININNFL
ncbi:MAG: rRNA maturation RNase YbeY [Bacteroidota bacterium]|nr:rRNA maturation RNase YbeY [Bacteroidota bacterium]